MGRTERSTGLSETSRAYVTFGMRVDGRMAVTTRRRWPDDLDETSTGVSERKEFQMEFTFEMGLLGALVLVVGGLVIGGVGYFIGEPSTGYEWLVAAIAAIAGGFVLSEFIVGFQTWEPVFDGLALIPATFGGLVSGAVVAFGSRLLSGETLGEARVS
jgi:hypothetical protein